MALPFVGCGEHLPGAAPVAGVVTLDGKPVTSGTVIFSPAKGLPAHGELDSQGRFVLSTYQEGDGAIIGEHRIAVVAVTEDDDSQHFERPPTKPVRSLLPERYASKTTSGLSFEVKQGEHNEARLELNSKGPKR